MKAQDVYKNALAASDMFVKMYLSDLTDQEMLVRPDPAANHIAWQIGHIIKSENGMVSAIKPGSAIKLPDGFSDKHTKAAAGSNNPRDFLSKKEYLDLYDRQRAATAELIATITDDELARPGPESMRAFAPTVANLLYIIASHPMLHCGQFVVLRRKLGKPVQL